MPREGVDGRTSTGAPCRTGRDVRAWRGTVTGNITGIDPNLAVVACNSGRTQTNAFPSGAPPMNAGNPTACLDHTGSPALADQRDGARLKRCDQGAFELASCRVIGDVDEVAAVAAGEVAVGRHDDTGGDRPLGGRR